MDGEMGNRTAHYELLFMYKRTAKSSDNILCIPACYTFSHSLFDFIKKSCCPVGNKMLKVICT